MHRISIPLVAAITLIAVPSLAAAQTANGPPALSDPEGSVTVLAVQTPNTPTSGTIGNSNLISQPGAPNVTTPGIVGTGAFQSGFLATAKQLPAFRIEK